MIPTLVRILVDQSISYPAITRELDKNRQQRTSDCEQLLATRSKWLLALMFSGCSYLDYHYFGSCAYLIGAVVQSCGV